MPVMVYMAWDSTAELRLIMSESEMADCQGHGISSGPPPEFVWLIERSNRF